MLKSINLFSIIFILVCTTLPAQSRYDVTIIGGGASGTMAAIQAAREGISVCLIEEGPWLGGMLTSAGVSAIDGNHQIAGGLWQEFRQHLYDHYGGPAKVATGWVSNTLFEPHVGDSILKVMVKKESNITIHFSSVLTYPPTSKNGLWKMTFIDKKRTSFEIFSKLIIDATELGDVYASLSSSYDIGMDSKDSDQELFAPTHANQIVQDLTYVMILKDYGKEADRTISKPLGYRKEDFLCACETADPSAKNTSRIDCHKMMAYGKLPYNKYMINWPNCGNDFYTNIIDEKIANRNSKLKNAKQHSLCFLYYLQTELGYKNLGLADDEFPTPDLMPMLPYHRESRRIHGRARLLANHLISPFDQKEAYYKTGIAVGDYPIDHHHKKNTNAPNIDFINIKIGSYNLPLGSLIPKDLDNFIVAEKSISVSNIVNGTTRLQPVVLGIGQAAGAIAAEAIMSRKSIEKISIRNVQQRLIKSKAYIMPYIDVPNNDPDFEVIQKIGATGILKGRPIPYKWANQTWFYPDSLIYEIELKEGLKDYNKSILKKEKGAMMRKSIPDHITLEKFIQLMTNLNCKIDIKQALHYLNLKNPNDPLSRRVIAKLLNHYYKPFEKSINFDGR